MIGEIGALHLKINSHPFPLIHRHADCGIDRKARPYPSALKVDQVEDGLAVLPVV